MNFGLRELAWLLVGLLGAYTTVVVVRILGLGRRKAPPASAPAHAGQVAAPAFLQELESQQWRRELSGFQERLAATDAAWRAAVAALEVELARLRESQGAIQAQRHVSPQYGEAMVLARRGLEPEAVAERCGISVAEAALVCALARGGPVEGS